MLNPPVETQQNTTLINEIIDQEVMCAKLRRHRLASATELREFATLLAKSAPVGITVLALRWCYNKHRNETQTKMTPSALHSLFYRFRKTPGNPRPIQERKRTGEPERFSVVIAHRLMRALGLQGPQFLAPLMPGDSEILSRPPSRQEADEFFSSISKQELEGWMRNPRYPYSEYTAPTNDEPSDDWGWQ